uniref:Uncharacterized protein n=1 Tax=Sus scrofa TaxID=9823 RepID=A0A8D1FEA0_PIG
KGVKGVFTLYITSPEIISFTMSCQHLSFDNSHSVFCSGFSIRVMLTTNQSWYIGQIHGICCWRPASHLHLWVMENSNVFQGPHLLQKRRLSWNSDCLPLGMMLSNKAQLFLNIKNKLMDMENRLVQKFTEHCKSTIKKIRKKKIIFLDYDMKSIGGLISNIYNYKVLFIQDMNKFYRNEPFHSKKIKKCFKEEREGFLLRTQHCWNDTYICMKIIHYMVCINYSHFIEFCRLFAKGIPFTIEGEIKNFSVDRSSRQKINKATEILNNLTQHLNELERKLHKMGKIAQWEGNHLRWNITDRSDRSSSLSYTISGSYKHQPYKKRNHRKILFFLDNLMVSCLKLLLKRFVLYFLGRISAILQEVVGLPDGR